MLLRWKLFEVSSITAAEYFGPHGWVLGISNRLCSFSLKPPKGVSVSVSTAKLNLKSQKTGKTSIKKTVRLFEFVSFDGPQQYVVDDSLLVEAEILFSEVTVVEPPSSFAGLKNLGQTCYANAALQILYFLPSVRDSAVLPELQQVFSELEKGGGYVVDSTWDLITLLGFHTDRQEDTQEFFARLREKETSMLDLFGGHYCRTTECASVNVTSTNQNRFYELSIDGSEDLESGLLAYCGTSHLDYQTEDHGLQDATTTLRITELPNVLAFHMNNFEFKSGEGIKISQFTDIPFEYTPPPKCLSTEAASKTYSLHSVLMHTGESLEVGHYFSYIRPNLSDSTWYKFDDQVVTQHRGLLDFDELFLAGDLAPYMIFYVSKESN